MKVRALWHHIGFVLTAVVALYLVSHVFEPPRLNWGETGSDYNTMTSGRNFVRYGFVTLRFTPLIIDRSVVTPADSTQGYVYTHYPPLPDLMNGVLRKVFRLSELPQFRLVALAFSFASLAFVYGLVGAYWSRQTAQVALGLWVTNPLWIQHADYLHHGPYAAFFGFGSLWFLARALRNESRRDLLAAGAFLFFTYLASYDYWIFVPLLMAAMTVRAAGLWSRRTIMTLGVLATFAVAAIGVKAGTNMWALHGFAAYLRDLRYQALVRSTNTFVGTGFDAGVWPVMFGRVSRFFTILIFPLAVFWGVVAILRRRAPVLAATPNPLVILAAALPFLMIFRELWIAQYYPALMLIPFYAVGFASVITAAAESRRWTGTALASALLVALTWNAVDDVARFRRAFFPEHEIATLRAQLDAVMPPGRRVMANHMWADAYRHYFNRNIVPLIMHPATDIPGNIEHFSDPRTPEFSTVIVQHKRMLDEMYDKGYYWVLARYRFWNMLGDPRPYRRDIDGILRGRDLAITREAARRGRKIYEDSAFVIWEIPPSAPSPSR